jgi:hypothetical protein
MPGLLVPCEMGIVVGYDVSLSERTEAVAICVVRPLGRNVTDEISILGRDLRFSPGCDIYLGGMR